MVDRDIYKLRVIPLMRLRINKMTELRVRFPGNRSASFDWLFSEQDIFTFHYFASRIFYSFYDRLTYKDIKNLRPSSAIGAFNRKDRSRDGHS